MTAASFDLTGKKIWVAGHTGMVGSAIVRRLAREACETITTARADTDLFERNQVDRFVERARPDAIILAAAKVGGILANDTYPADFLHQNLLITCNVIGAAHKFGVRKLLFLGSSCIYPRDASQPIGEAALLTGPLEPTNEWYAIAKIAGVKLCQAFRKQYGCDFISAMPTNLYGPNDNFDPKSSHVLAAFIAKAHAIQTGAADRFEIWGSGEPKREFLHVDDCADALVHLLQRYSGMEPVNIGSGEEVSIRNLAIQIMMTAGLDADIIFDRSKPDGAPRKLLDSARLRATGWRPRIALADGLRATYDWYAAQQPTAPQAGRI